MTSNLPLYSDRIKGPLPRTLGVLPDGTKAGLAALIERHIEANWLAHEFPERCPDGNGVAGTNTEAFLRTIRALIPGVPWPLWRSEGVTNWDTQEENASDEQVFDLIEYITPLLVRPEEGVFHQFFGHHELRFTSIDGSAKFREQVNLLLQRGGTVFTLALTDRIELIGSPAVQGVLASLRPNTGDTQVDEAIAQAGDLLLSRRMSDRMTSLEKLWGAFERLKTLDDRDKKKSVRLLLAHVRDDASREVLEAEMNTLTGIGNNFNIRHKETRTNPVQPEFIEYLFARLGNLLIILLDQAHRLD